MTKTEIAMEIARLLDGLNIHDAISIMADAEQISAMNSNKHHSFISVGVVANMINTFHARAGVVSLEDDGVVLRVQKENKMLNFKIPKQ